MHRKLERQAASLRSDNDLPRKAARLEVWSLFFDLSDICFLSLALQADSPLHSMAIMHGERWIVWVVGLSLLATWAGCGYFSRDARMARRRRKSHNRIITKANRPSIRFSVRAPKK